ncbi:MAG: signal peptide peptidase SppA [Melioribacteraceae bacterium]|nr:signal peptide peptidase SppA [Melioribacteraceae bacterium]
MKDFLKVLLASLLGTFIAIFIVVIGFFLFVSIMISVFSAEETVSISPKTVLELEFNYQLPERTSYKPADNFGFMLPALVKQLGLNDVVKNIEKAKTDNDIAGIYLKLNNLMLGSYADVKVVRDALEGFKDSGKFIIAGGDRISMKAYYLASVADSIYLIPTGELDLRGMLMELTFFKNTLDKLDIEAQVFKSGKYKSAVEMFSSEEMSRENREQLDEFLNSVFEDVLGEISRSRNIDFNDLKSLVENYESRNTNSLVPDKLIDGLEYHDEIIKVLKSLCSVNEDKDLKKVTLQKYSKVPGESDEYTSNRIAVIYALGEIHEGKGDEESIGYENISRELSRVRKNDKIRAVVLRINSPGGSPLTSEQVLREVKLTSEKKPVVASFGSVAASGGYYIAAESELIFAEPYSITGSIGAFGIVPNLKGFFNNKLGITFDSIEKGKFSGMFSLTAPLSSEEKEILMERINDIYITFKSRVAEGRKMSEQYIDEIAQGRVWSGLQAKEIGLVDKLGGLNDAIREAARLAGIDEYRVVEYPSLKDPFEKILNLLYAKIGSTNSIIEVDDINTTLRKTNEFFLKYKFTTRIPYDIIIN